MQFRLGSIPVRVRAPFLLMAVLLGGSSGEPKKVLAWAVIVFVSVLVHELGHALVGRAFGLAPQIELHGMGGTTSWTAGRDIGNGRSIAISLAGPFAGFAFGLLVLLAIRLGFAPKGDLADYAIRQLLWVNIGWGVVNLVPMLPLDGGNVMRSLLNMLTQGRGERAARIVSIATAGLGLLYALSTGWLWLGMLAALFAYMNVQALRRSSTRSFDEPLAAAIARAYRALDAQDGAQALALLRPVLVPEASEALRRIALRIFAYALLIEGEWDELLPLLERERLLIGADDLERYARTARELDRSPEADRIDALVSLLRPRMANDFSA